MFRIEEQLAGAVIGAQACVFEGARRRQHAYAVGEIHRLEVELQRRNSRAAQGGAIEVGVGNLAVANVGQDLRFARADPTVNDFATKV